MTGLMSGHLGQIHGKPWFSFALRFNRNTKIMKERFQLNFNDVSITYNEGGIEIIPHTWYHQCSKLDTKTGAGIFSK